MSRALLTRLERLALPSADDDTPVVEGIVEDSLVTSLREQVLYTRGEPSSHQRDQLTVTLSKLTDWNPSILTQFLYGKDMKDLDPGEVIVLRRFLKINGSQEYDTQNAAALVEIYRDVEEAERAKKITAN